MFERVLNGLTYSYSNLENDENLKFWTDYYKNNGTAVDSYYTGAANMTPQKIEEIKKSAKNTADGFFHILEVDEHGNTETQYKCDKPDVIKGVAFITNIPNPQIPGVKPENIIMSVGVFTTKLASFYIMVGICTGYRYDGEKKSGLSGVLAGYVANIINESRFTDGGNIKKSFITRPLQVMGQIFKSSASASASAFATTELNIEYDDSLSLPEPSDESYASVKREIVKKGHLRQKEALDWLKQCQIVISSDNKSAISECIGDVCFFYHFVLDIFSPKWGYTGKRIGNLIQSFKGGNKYSKKYNKQKRYSRKSKKITSARYRKRK